MNELFPLLSSCWAKTDPETNRPALTVWDHCLTVGMVAHWLRRLAPEIIQRWLPDGADPLIAAHDIGKITPGFLLKADGWTFPGALPPGLYEGNHAKVSQAFLATLPAMQHPNRRPFKWIMSAGGHHGKYPSGDTMISSFSEGDFEWPGALRQELLEKLTDCFGPLPTADVPKGPRLHAFTGFTSFADWIGSDLRWFPVTTDGVLQDRLTTQDASAQARAAVEEIGWHRRKVRASLGFPDLFPTLKEPRPLQDALIRAMDQPGLYVVEAPMGEGKTEAALAGAYRRWSTGGERGLYFALPTQLTSARIHDRIEALLERVVEDPATLALVHGNAWLDPKRVTTVMPAASPDSVSRDLVDWYASGRKAMLAAFGTGTIDQALMATLPVKHSGLRLFALAGKVVVIDEVHSYDPYTSALLDRTVEWLLELGGSVVILSATLSKARRAALVKAAGATAGEDSPAYPLLTKVGREERQAEYLPVPANPLRAQSVALDFLPADGPAALELAAHAAEQGACVLIIRNTVALAQETYRSVKSLCRDAGLQFGLLHSRFPQFQRRASEKEWMDRLGERGDGRPRGCILVATQVVEQSVDIDADLLLTDLAPVDLVLQRIGRLHRHQRPRPAGYETPRCILLSPDLPGEDASAKDLKAALGPSGYVYPPASLLQAHRVLRTWPGGTVELPGDIRPLVEAGVDASDAVPGGERELRREQERKVAEMLRSAGIQDVFRSVQEDDKEGRKTRWGDKSTAWLVLLRKPPETRGSAICLTFLDGSSIEFHRSLFRYDLALALHANATRIPLYLVGNSLDKQPSWLGLHMHDAVLATASEDTTSCNLLDADGADPYRLDYHSALGVSYSKSIVTTYFHSEPEEDGWW